MNDISTFNKKNPVYSSIKHYIRVLSVFFDGCANGDFEYIQIYVYPSVPQQSWHSDWTCNFYTGVHPAWGRHPHLYVPGYCCLHSPTQVKTPIIK